MKTMRSDSATGNGCNTTELMTANIAMLAPRQIASVRIAVAENPRSFQSSLTLIHISRSALFMSCNYALKIPPSNLIETF
jgi:hypothetical protein